MAVGVCDFPGAYVPGVVAAASSRRHHRSARLPHQYPHDPAQLPDRGPAGVPGKIAGQGQ